MQTRFKFEMQAVTTASKARKGISLTSSTRAMNIAKSSRNITKLNLVGQIEASRLVKYVKGAKFIGNGLAVLNFGAGVADSRKSYKSGENWEKEMFVESATFAFSAGAGTIAAGAGEAVLTFLLVATPVDWLGLIWGGVAVIGVTGAVAGASIWAGNISKDRSGSFYDKIMNTINSKL